MAYLVNKTNGDLLVSVADGTANTSATNLTFIGKNFVGYGEILNENFLRLLENFAYESPPANSVKGQLWYDATNNRLNVYNGSTFKTISLLTYQSTTPTGGVNGELWFDSTNDLIYVYKNSTWVGANTKGLSEETVVDIATLSHKINKLTVDGTTVAIISKDASFIPQTPITGFAAIVPGININDSIAGATIRTPAISVAANATVQGNLSVTGNITSNIGNMSAVDAAFTGNISANKFTGDVQGSVTGSIIGNVVANDATVLVNYINKNITSGNITVSGNTSTANLSVTGNASITGNATISGNLTVNGGTTTVSSTVVTVTDPIFTLGGATAPGSDDGKDRGIEFRWHNGTAARLGFFGFDRSTQRFTVISNATNTSEVFSGSAADAEFGVIYGTSTTARYGDLAEYYIADDKYEPGTVLVFGGEQEVTVTDHHADTRVAGIVTTNPAYLMNSQQADQRGAVAIALRGRVPCKVYGPVQKGDLLVTSTIKGHVMAQRNADANAVVAKSLENNLDPGPKTIIAVVQG